MTNSQATLQELKKHIIALRDTFHAIHQDPSLAEDPHKLAALAQMVQDVEVEALLSKDHKHRRACDLIHHLVFTPWGAPFVTDESLLEAAQSYKFQKHKSSSFYDFISAFLEHSEASERQIFEAFDDIIAHMSDI